MLMLLQASMSLSILLPLLRCRQKGTRESNSKEVTGTNGIIIKNKNKNKNGNWK